MPTIKEYKQWVFVEVEKGATTFQFYGTKEIEELRYLTMGQPEKFKWHKVPLGPGSYTLIGLLSQVTEEQAREIVDELLYPMTNDIMGYEDYTNKGYSQHTTALDSLHSLIRSLGMNEHTVIIKKQ